MSLRKSGSFIYQSLHRAYENFKVKRKIERLKQIKLDRKEKAKQIKKERQERKRIEEEVLFEAKGLVQKEEKSDILILSGKKWHNGVIGIVASRVAEQFNKPTIIISTTDKECKGSARSIAGINIIFFIYFLYVDLYHE